MEINKHLCDAGVHMGFGYRMYSIQGGLSHNACKRVLYCVVYTIDKGVAVVNTASNFCVVPNLVHIVVATLNDRVDVRDKVEI